MTYKWRPQVTVGYMYLDFFGMVRARDKDVGYVISARCSLSSEWMDELTSERVQTEDKAGRKLDTLKFRSLLRGRGSEGNWTEESHEIMMPWKPGEENISRKRGQSTMLNGAERLSQRTGKRMLGLVTWMSVVTLAKAVLKRWEWLFLYAHERIWDKWVESVYRVQSLVKERRSYKTCSEAKKLEN